MASRRDVLGALGAQRKAAVGATLVGSIALIAIVGPWLVGDPLAVVGVPRAAPSAAHWFGLNGQGQDVLAQTVAGARVTLAVAFSVGALVTLIGAAVGVSAGYFGGRIDDALSVVTNVFLVIPGLPLAVVLAAYLPPGPVSLAAVLSLAGWAWNARVFRSQALSLRRRDYVAAAIVAGEPHRAVIAREIAPNMLSILVSAFIGATIYAVGAQVGLEFLGLGDVSAVTWGTNLYWAANDAALITGTWWEFLPTGLGVALVGFGLVLVNFAIDELGNPRLRARALRHRASPPRRAGDPACTRRSAPALELRDVTITYPNADAPAVTGVSLTIEPGQFVGLAGESGSGKSTLGHAILRLLPDEAQVQGAICVGGDDVTRMSPARLRAFRWRRASMVFQSALNALNPVLTIREQLVDTLRAHEPITTEAATARAGELLELVGLDRAHLAAHPHTLSGGMRQRVVIAIALALRPRLLVMDEPTTALDVVVQKQILERVLALQSELGFAVLFISHDLRLMLSLADVVGVMQRGRLVEVGPTEQLRASPQHAYTRKLLASDEPPPAPADPPPVAATGTPLLRVRGLSRCYAGTAVLDDVSFEVGAGEVVALVGQSGSGKSTIARLLARLEPPDAGTIELGGEGALAMPARAYRARVQKVFQDPFASLNPVHRVAYHLARPLLRFGRATDADVEAKVLALLTSVGIEPAAEIARRYPHQLSGGQRQRVAVARALAAQPELIIADEPTSMLDASVRAELLELVRALARQRGVAVLLITHDLASAARYADRALVLHRGRIVESGPAARVFARPADDYTALLVEAAAFAGRRSAVRADQPTPETRLS